MGEWMHGWIEGYPLPLQIYPDYPMVTDLSDLQFLQWIGYANRFVMMKDYDKRTMLIGTRGGVGTAELKIGRSVCR